MKFCLLFLLSFFFFNISFARDSWSIEHHRGLVNRQRGDLSFSLFGNRVFSHAFLEPIEIPFDNNIPKNARIELIVSILESEDIVWDANPMREVDSNGFSPKISLIIHRDWDTASGRFFSVSSIDVRTGTHRLVVPVDSWAWINVYGKTGNSSKVLKSQFHRNWTGYSRIGLCAGGRFKAHGISVTSGHAIIKVLSLRKLPN
jgi:hypothetical protein